jgi:hypothetical protein
MNGYIAFYKGRRHEVYALTAYDAQKQAAQYFKATKAYEVSVMLAEKGGQPVVHTAT